MDKTTQCAKLLSELMVRDLSVRDIMFDLWINSPTKIVSELRRKGHKIVDVGTKKHSVYRLVD